MYVLMDGTAVYESDVEPDWHRPGSREYLLAQSREWMWGRLQGRRALKSEEGQDNGDD